MPESTRKKEDFDWSQYLPPQLKPALIAISKGKAALATPDEKKHILRNEALIINYSASKATKKSERILPPSVTLSKSIKPIIPKELKMYIKPITYSHIE